MKRKIGTSLNEDLYLRLKEAAKEQGLSVNEALAEGLRRFLRARASRASIVAETRGTYKVSARALRMVMEEDVYEDD